MSGEPVPGLELWTAIDRYLADLFVGSDPALASTLSVSDDEGLPSISVSAMHGKLLHVLTKLQRAQRVLEVGTLGGYSAIWIARALPPTGRLITLERDPHHAEVARRNLDAAGVGSAVEIRLGAAADTLARMVEENEPAFDMIFLDADKRGYSHYLDRALELSRPGSLIVADNVVWKGKVLHGHTEDENAAGVRRFLEHCAREPRLETTVIQTVGTKGYDGVALARVND